MTTDLFVHNQTIEAEEDRFTEFKEIYGRDPLHSILNLVEEYVVAFLNAEGGRILWGIRDHDRKVVGVQLSARQKDELRRALANKFFAIQPSVAPSSFRVHFHPIYKTCQRQDTMPDLFVVELVIPTIQNPHAPYFTQDGKAFIRLDGLNKKLSGPELTEEIRNRLLMLQSESQKKKEQGYILVTNLSYHVSERDLRETFREVGDVFSVEIPLYKGKRQGFGIVEMSAEDAQKAHRKFNDAEIKGRRIFSCFFTDKEALLLSMENERKKYTERTRSHRSKSR